MLLEDLGVAEESHEATPPASLPHKTFFTNLTRDRVGYFGQKRPKLWFPGANCVASRTLSFEDSIWTTIYSQPGPSTVCGLP